MSSRGSMHFKQTPDSEHSIHIFPQAIKQIAKHDISLSCFCFNEKSIFFFYDLERWNSFFQQMLTLPLDKFNSVP